MKFMWKHSFFISMFFCGVACAKSLLVPMEMPKTISDISFVERMENEAEGYEPFMYLNAYEKLQFVESESVAQTAVRDVLTACQACSGGVCAMPNSKTNRSARSVVARAATGGSMSRDGLQDFCYKVVANQEIYYPPEYGCEHTNTCYRTGSTKKYNDGLGYCKKVNSEIPVNQKIPFGLPVNTSDINFEEHITEMRRAGLIPSGGKTVSELVSQAKNIANNTNNGLMGAPYLCRCEYTKHASTGKKGWWTRPHEGVDIGVHLGFYRMPIYAPADGFVKAVLSLTDTGVGAVGDIYDGRFSYTDEYGSTHSLYSISKPAGNYIKIDHGDGWQTNYMHLDEIFVRVGQRVEAGCLIGMLGYSGGNKSNPKAGMGVDKSHLHYEIEYHGNLVNIQAPNNKIIPLVQGGMCGNGARPESLCPNALMVYDKSLGSAISTCTNGQKEQNNYCAEQRSK